MRDLYGEAAALGVQVHFAHIDDDPELLGYWVPSARIVVVRLGMTKAQTRAVLAHELAHALLGHECSDGPEERRADQLAADMLIAPEDYAAAEAIDSTPAAIAEELETTEAVVVDYQTYCLQRLGHRTYSTRPWARFSNRAARELARA